MFTQVERARTLMDSDRDNRRRVAAAAQVDRCFDTYEIAMGPDEALSFAATAPEAPAVAEFVYVLIDVVNQAIPPANFGPNHPRTGSAHHKFYVGRRDGDRVVTVEIFRGYLKTEYPFDELRAQLCDFGRKANCAVSQELDENVCRIRFRWAARGPQ